jgi:hypothetical protein
MENQRKVGGRMKHAVLARCLKGIEIFIVLVGVLFYALMVPAVIGQFGRDFPEFEYLVMPSIIVISLSAIPVLVALALFWMICSNIARENSFCIANAKYLTAIGICSIIDSVYCFAFAVYLGSVGASSPGTAIICLGIIVAGLAIAVAAFLLSHLVYKAAQMEDEIKHTV